MAAKVENAKDLYVCAAKGVGGRVAVVLCRYTDNDNRNGSLLAAVPVVGLPTARITCHLTDPCRAHTEFPLVVENGCVTVPLERNAFALVEFE